MFINNFYALVCTGNNSPKTTNNRFFLIFVYYRMTLYVFQVVFFCEGFTHDSVYLKCAYVFRQWTIYRSNPFMASQSLIKGLNIKLRPGPRVIRV